MTQSDQVSKELKNGSITDLKAYKKYGIRRLSSIIHRLRRKGIKIKTTLVKSKDRFGKACQYAKYSLK